MPKYSTEGKVKKNQELSKSEESENMDSHELTTNAESTSIIVYNEQEKLLHILIDYRRYLDGYDDTNILKHFQCAFMQQPRLFTPPEFVAYSLDLFERCSQNFSSQPWETKYNKVVTLLLKCHLLHSDPLDFLPNKNKNPPEELMRAHLKSERMFPSAFTNNPQLEKAFRTNLLLGVNGVAVNEFRLALEKRIDPLDASTPVEIIRQAVRLANGYFLHSYVSKMAYYDFTRNRMFTWALTLSAVLATKDISAVPPLIELKDVDTMESYLATIGAKGLFTGRDRSNDTELVALELAERSFAEEFARKLPILTFPDYILPVHFLTLILPDHHPSIPDMDALGSETQATISTSTDTLYSHYSGPYAKLAAAIRQDYCAFKSHRPNTDNPSPGVYPSTLEQFYLLIRRKALFFLLEFTTANTAWSQVFDQMEKNLKVNINQVETTEANEATKATEGGSWLSNIFGKSSSKKCVEPKGLGEEAINKIWMKEVIDQDRNELASILLPYQHHMTSYDRKEIEGFLKRENSNIRKRIKEYLANKFSKKH